MEETLNHESDSSENQSNDRFSKLKTAIEIAKSDKKTIILEEITPKPTKTRQLDEPIHTEEQKPKTEPAPTKQTPKQTEPDYDKDYENISEAIDFFERIYFNLIDEDELNDPEIIEKYQRLIPIALQEFPEMILRHYQFFNERGEKELCQKAISRVLKKDPLKIIANYQVIKDVPRIKEVIQEAIKIVLETNPGLFLSHYHLFKDVPGGKEACQKAIKIVLEKDPNTILGYYDEIKDVPGAKEAYQEAQKKLGEQNQ